MAATRVNIRRGRIGVLVCLLATALAGAASPARAAPQIPAPFTVNSLADAPASAPLDSGPCETAPGNRICTLRAAVMKANHFPGGGAAIILPAEPAGEAYTLDIPKSGADDETTGDLNISSTVTINGGGASHTIVDGNGSITLDDVFFIESGAALTLTGLTVGDGVSHTFGFAGGINNYGTLTVISSTISGNHGGEGGGLLNLSRARLVDSALRDNTATDLGGGLDNAGGQATLINSTVSGNAAANSGGGIVSYGSLAVLSLFNVTVADNVADSNLDRTGTGGGLDRFAGSVFLQNSLLADNLATDFDPERGYFFAPDDCAGTLTSQDYNLVSYLTASCTFLTAPHDQTNVAAHLGPMQDNGGPTWTQALLPGSPAIDAGNNIAGCVDDHAAPLTTDQRGFPRPAFGGKAFRCDIGAYELQQLAYLPLVRK